MAGSDLFLRAPEILRISSHLPAGRAA